MIRPRRKSVIPHPSDPTLAIVQLTKGYFAVISAVDGAAVGRHFWHARIVEGSTPYAARASKRSDGRVTTQSLHRFVGDLMGLALNAEVDHENGNGIDCRRSNLRDASHGENVHNSRTFRSNTTGIKGVSRHRTRPDSRERYVARVMLDGRSRYLGTFDTIAMAAAAVRSARPALHGAFTNHGGTA